MASYKPTCGAQIWFWKRHAEARYLFTSLRLFLAVFRYHILCFKHFGWIALAMAILKTPEHLKAVALALFTHPKNPPQVLTQTGDRPR
jgi:hypothetical protein